MSEIVVAAHDNGTVSEARLDDEIVVRLAENLSTGYGWEMEPLGTGALELIDSTYAEAPRIALGRGGTRILRFAARSPGSHQIRLALRRSWDPSDMALEHFEVTIRVQPAG